MSEHDSADVVLLRNLADRAERRNARAAAQRLRDVAATVESEHVEPDGYECGCGKSFETSNALGGHRSHCDDAEEGEDA